MARKRILTIQDISCVGQCSTTIALPILSLCGHETCVLPSKLLSTHTGGFGKPAIVDLAAAMGDFHAHWHSAGITFDAICTGYLGSLEAIDAAGKIMDTLLAPGGKIIVDPAMADHGKLYSGFNESYAEAMGRLCRRAHVMLPNITEAAIMTGLPYREELDESYVRRLLGSLGGGDVILTGVGYHPGETGAAIRHGGCVTAYHHPRYGKGCHGTGDLFAACFAGAWLRGWDLEDAVKLAADVTCKAIENTWEDPDPRFGVKFETALPYLLPRLEKMPGTGDRRAHAFLMNST